MLATLKKAKLAPMKSEGGHRFYERKSAGREGFDGPPQHESAAAVMVVKDNTVEKKGEYLREKKTLGVRSDELCHRKL